MADWAHIAVFNLFKKKGIEIPEPEAVPDGFLVPVTGAALLNTPRRVRLLQMIWQLTSVSRAQFDLLYRSPLERFAALAQQTPASESHHHSHLGGMIDHGLEVIVYGLQLRKSHLLPAGAPPEVQATQSEAWSAAVAYGCLLHDVGKLAVDIQVELVGGERWFPWHGELRHPYRFRYRQDRQYRLHQAAAGLIYARLLDTDILDWLSGFPECWASLLHVLSGQYEYAGVLGQLVVQADRASTARDLGGDPTKIREAPRQALQRKLLLGLRHLLREGMLKINQAQASDGWLTDTGLFLVSKTCCDKLRAYLLSQGVEGIPSSNPSVFDVLQEHRIVTAAPDGKAIWRATVIGRQGWTQNLSFLCVAPTLIWDQNEMPPLFDGEVRVDDVPVDGENTARDNSSPLTSHQTGEQASTSEKPSEDSIPVPSATGPDLPPSRTRTLSATPPEVSSDDLESGERFLHWLREGIHARRIIINDARAIVHIVSGTVFVVSPGVFQRYAQEQAAGSMDWERLQKRFERLGVHRRQPDGLNIWTCTVTGPRRTRKLHGYLIEDFRHLFDLLPPNNPFLSL